MTENGPDNSKRTPMTEPETLAGATPPLVLPVKPVATAPACCTGNTCHAGDRAQFGIRSLCLAIWNIPASIAIFLVRIYQWTLSPIVGRQCRFYPSCSNYYILAVRKNGFIVGSCRGFWRICRCNPFCQGGVDFP